MLEAVPVIGAWMCFEKSRVKVDAGTVGGVADGVDGELESRQVRRLHAAVKLIRGYYHEAGPVGWSVKGSRMRPYRRRRCRRRRADGADTAHGAGARVMERGYHHGAHAVRVGEAIRPYMLIGMRSDNIWRTGIYEGPDVAAGALVAGLEHDSPDVMPYEPACRRRSRMPLRNRPRPGAAFYPG